MDEMTSDSDWAAAELFDSAEPEDSRETVSRTRRPFFYTFLANFARGIGESETEYEYVGYDVPKKRSVKDR